MTIADLKFYGVSLNPENVALNKTGLIAKYKDGTDAPVNPDRPISHAVDGSKNNCDANHAGIGSDYDQAGTTSVYFQVDLEDVYSVSSINLFRYWNGGRSYTNTVVAISETEDFANPTIMLFIGGFVLAIGMTKTKLDVVLARILLKPFGTKSETVLLGFILVTALFSAFVSNTATAAMMLAFLGPVLRSLPADGKGRIALALAIPVGANLGGIMTPIGTPPNLIVLDNLNKFNGIDITFPEWMMRMTPFVIVLLFISWFLLKILFPFKQKTINLVIEGEMKKGYQSTTVIVTFIVTIFLWMFGKELWGLNTNVVAMIPIAAFCATGILQRRDLEEINWSVLWMVAGGFALGVALDKTGLGNVLVESIPFASWSPLIVMIISGLVCFLFSNFISHSAAASLLAPILGLVASGISSDPTAGEAFASMGGPSALMVGVAISSSVSMILPISTPPNAIAHSTGFIEQKDMMKVGIIMGILGLVLGYAMLIIFKF